MAKKKILGNASLIIVAGGLVVLESAMHLGVVSGPFWRIIAAGFEAGTIGGLADWFAVSALFREVPIPLIRRHTNIIVKNRARLTEGAVDLVTNQWLSPDVVKAKLAKLSFSETLLRVLQEPSNQEPAIEFIRDVLSRLAVNLDKPQVAEFLEKLFKEQLERIDLAKPIGRWMADAIREGRHQELWNIILDSAEKTVNDEEIRYQILHRVDEAIHEFKEKDFLKRAFRGIAEFLGVLHKDVIAGKIIEKIKELILAARNNPSHPLREKIDTLLLDFSKGLSSGDPSLTAMVDGFKAKLINNADTKAIIQRGLSEFKSKLSDQLEQKDSAFMLVLTDYLRQILGDLQSDALVRESLDGWMRDTITGLAEKYHHTIGDMIRTSLHPEKLDDRGLVNQIEEKVGNDLQYIRLNGAVVGGLVGILLGLIRFLLSGR
jgi:uncharacterized membrane-anchored protein YjiN (DUF445 family)